MDQGELLVVDDEPFLRDAVAASLRFLGFDVSTADTGSEALRLVREQPFGLVVLDVMLPDTGGFEIVRRLRSEGCHVPVIFLTAKDTQADKVTGLTLGGDVEGCRWDANRRWPASADTAVRRERDTAGSCRGSPVSCG